MTALSPVNGTAPDLRRSFPTRRELALIALFWTMYALLIIANRLFDPGSGSGGGAIGGRATIAFVESFCWAATTAPVFWLAARLDLEDELGLRARVTQLVGLALLAITLAVVIGWLGTVLRVAMASTMPPPVRFGRGLGNPRGPSFWFGFVNALITALGVIATGVARAYSLRFRARREQAARLQAQLVEARLDALRRQLDPHFLFNTLNAVSSLVERDPRGVRRMIARLSELLRYSFEGGGEPEVPLREELTLLTRYIDIMQVRFQGRLTVEVRVADDALEALVPSLVLQPLVENAIRHGVERLTKVGHIAVEGTVAGGTLVLRVRDNGASSGAFDEPGDASARGSGVGLRNTRARLAQLYGDAQRLTLERIGGVEEGMVAEIRLPYHTRGGARAIVRPSVTTADMAEDIVHVH
ncbi:MAG: histidine kinase internal region [Gemmatimonadetes bacterium]|nr:histidine kinase internal region [Gemmatimonadota bacterium]